MSKAIQGAAELAGAVGMGIAMFAEASTGVGIAAIPAEMKMMTGLAVAGVMSEAGALAQMLGSKTGLGVTTRTPAAHRRVIRGMQRLGGTIVYQSTTGSTNRQYNMVIALASHPCSALVNLYLDGRQVFWNGGEYNQTCGGFNFGGNPDGSNHTGPNGVQYNFGDLVFCAAFQGKQTSAYTINLEGAWVGPSTITDSSPTSYPGFCSALNANDPTWAPVSGGAYSGTPYMAGCTYVYLKIEADAGTFPQFPEIRFTIMGKNDIWDPRTETYGYTANAALQIADAITDPTWGLGDDSVNQDQLIAAANICDEEMACAAGYETQFSLHYNYDTSTGPGEALQHMIESKLFRLTRAGGEWFIFPPSWAGSSFTFDENALLSDVQWSQKRPIAQLANRVTGTYIAPNYPYNTDGNLYDSNGFWNGMTANNFPFSFQPTDFPMYACDALHGYGEDVYLIADTPNTGAYNSANAYAAGAVVIYEGGLWQANEAVPAGHAPGTEDGSGNPYWSATGNYLPLDLNLDTTLSVSEAQRLAKIALLRRRQQGTGTLTMSLAAWQMMAMDIMEFNCAALSWADKLLEIAGETGVEMTLRCAPAPNAGGEGSSTEQDDTPALWVEVPINETDPSVYEWDDEGEELTPYDVPAYAGNINQYTVAPPTGVSVTSGLSTALVQPDGTVIPRILVEWTEPTDTYVTNGGFIEIQMTPHGTGAWQDVAIVSGQTTQFYIVGVISGDYYDVRIRAIRSSGATSAWVEIDDIEAGFAISASGLTTVAPPGTISAITVSSTDSMIIVSPFTAKLAGYTASCLPGGAVTLDGYTPRTFYYVYYYDPNFAGGAITPIPTENLADFENKPGYFLIGTVTTPPWTGPTYSPSTYSDTGNFATSNPSAAYDGNLSTYAQVGCVTSPPSFPTLYNGECVFSAFSGGTLSAAATLYVVAAYQIAAPTTPLTDKIEVSLDGGSTWTTLKSWTAAGSDVLVKQTFSMALSSGQDLSQVQVRVTATLSGTYTYVTSGFVQVFEIYVE